MAAWSFKRVFKVVLLAIFAVILSVVSLLFLVFWVSSVLVFRTEDFDPVKWSAPVSNAMDGTCYRGGMAADVRDRILAPGTSMESVERVLGRPDGRGPNMHQYTLGMCSGLGIDYDSLYVFFDDAGRVTRASIHQH